MKLTFVFKAHFTLLHHVTHAIFHQEQPWSSVSLGARTVYISFEQISLLLSLQAHNKMHSVISIK